MTKVDKLGAFLIIALTCAVLALQVISTKLDYQLAAQTRIHLELSQEVKRLNLLKDNQEVQKEKSCIISALWHEGRGEGADGIQAIASVLQNRKDSSLYPSTYCKVINQPSQFSYIAEGKPIGKVLEASIGASEKQTYTSIQLTADRLFNGTFKPSLDASVMWYHAAYAKPAWSRTKTKVKQIRKHIFYKSKHNDRK